MRTKDVVYVLFALFLVLFVVGCSKGVTNTPTDTTTGTQPTDTTQTAPQANTLAAIYDFCYVLHVPLFPSSRQTKSLLRP